MGDTTDSIYNLTNSIKQLVPLVNVTMVAAIASAVAAITSMFSTVTTLFISWKAESRLKFSSEIENDIRISKSFSELMSIANARGEAQLSEKTIELLFDRDFITKEDMSNPKTIHNKIDEASMFVKPIGFAQQNAAISAIADIGIKYPFLYFAARDGLKTLAESHSLESAKQALDRLETKKKNSKASNSSRPLP